MQQELARPVRRVVADVPLGVLGDRRADEPRLAVANLGVRLRELRPALAERLDLGARQLDARLDALEEGNVAVELRGDSIELGPGDFFGELALLVEDGARVARVRATSPVRCISIPRDDFLALVESEPSFALALLRELARRLAEARATV